jgi:CHAT domain-containing protein
VPQVEAIEDASASAGAATAEGSPLAALAPGDAVARLLAVDDASARLRLLAGVLDVVDPEALLCALKGESERLWHGDPGLSLRAAETLIDGAQLARRADHIALGLMAKGDALRLLGRYPDSLPFFEQAAGAFLDQGDQVGWARTRIGWLHAMHMLGRAEEALPVVERARAALIEHRQWLRAAALDVNTAVVCRQLGQLKRAVELCDRALDAYHALGDGAALPAARTRANKAILLTMLGEFRDALDLFAATRDVWLSHNQADALLRQDLLVATVYLGQGQYTRSLKLLVAILAAREQSGHDVDAAWAALCMVECYLGLNRNGEAVGLAQEAITRFERCGTPTEAAKARFYGSLALARLGEVEPALALLDEAAVAFDRAGLATELGLVTLQRARLHLSDGRQGAARTAAASARALFCDRGLAVRQAEAEIVEARAALSLEADDDAIGLAQSALAICEARGAAWLAHEAHFVLGRAARNKGDLSTAMAHGELAVSSIEQVQRGLATELRSHFLDDKLQVFRDALENALDSGQPARALGYLERAKSRALVDYLADNEDVRLRPRRSSTSDLIDGLTRLRDEHNWLYGRLHGYGLSRPQDAALTAAGVAAVQDAISNREQRIARLLEELALQDDGGVEGLAGAPANELLTPPALDEQTVLLEYFLHDDGGVVFVASQGGVEAVALGDGTTTLQRLLLRWQMSLEASSRALLQGRTLQGLQRHAVAALGGLYDCLLRPVEGHIAGKARVIVVPYGGSHTVPWHALHDGERFLLQRMEVSTCPSSSLLRLLAERRRRCVGQAVVFAHSQDGHLRHVHQEAADVAAILGGESYVEAGATREALRSAAPGCKVLHLAAHGEARLDNPTFAHLQLADGQLTTADVFNLELDGALVTLSACETGRSVVTGGDELIGLSRGFLFAGASALVQSLWRVEDGSTARLMARFYRELAGGRTAAAAMRLAQLALFDERDGAPYFWAPFQVVGRGDWTLTEGV